MVKIDQSLDVKTNTRFDRAILYISVFLFSMTIVLVSVQVLLRYLPIPIGIGHWTEPLARYTLIVGTYFGAAVAARNREHISLYFLLERLEVKAPRVYSVFQIVVNVIVVGFLLIALVAGFTVATRNWGSTFGGAQIVTVGQMMVMISTGLLLYFVYALMVFREDLVIARERLFGDVGQKTGESDTDRPTE